MVRVEIPIFAGTIDEAIRELISGKAEIVEDVLDPEEAERAAIRKVTELVKGGVKLWRSFRSPVWHTTVAAPISGRCFWRS